MMGRASRLAAAIGGAAAVLLAPAPAVAHEGHGPVGPGEFWSAWSPEPGILAGLALVGFLYARGVWRLWRRGGTGSGVARWRAACFAFALGVLVIALVSPVDALGESLFSGHMVQHLLLIVVAAPLLVLGAPLLTLLWGLPGGTRRRIGEWWTGAAEHPAAAGILRGAVRGLSRAATAPAVAWTAYVLVFWAWHAPRLYEAALGSEALHILEHASFLVTALLFWWVVLHAHGRRRLGPGGSVFYLIAAGVQGSALGALLTFSRTVWYSAGSEAAALWGITPLEDQQLAGLIMWVPPVVVYLGTAAWILARWLEADGRPAERYAPRVRRPEMLLLFALLGSAVLAACGDGGMSRQEPAREVIPPGDVERGKRLIGAYGCGACHTVPGVREASGKVAPPLNFFSRRGYIAGKVANVPGALIGWIMSPDSVEPGTAMPDLDVSEEDARDIATYLYTLE